MPKIYAYRFTVPAEVIDENGHVNNVAYVQWMQDVATMHSDEQGCTWDLYQQLGNSWVARSHQIEYLSPAFAGDELEILTWVCNLKRSRSMRRYRFYRSSDRKLLAKAETDWVYVDMQTGRPRSVDEQVKNAFELVLPDEEP